MPAPESAPEFAGARACRTAPRAVPALTRPCRPMPCVSFGRSRHRGIAHLCATHYGYRIVWRSPSAFAVLPCVSS
ncbi:hypothetical protein X976_5610 [Burkholderia pseudomallei MSHR7500]|nr:hypothetical protein X976_5610 [Burkholderia pseudomallei MSHR7500]